MSIGTLGPITFSSSSDKVQTFEEFNLEKTSRIAIHDNLQNKPILEFIGPGLDKIAIKLTWSIEGKINPLIEIGKLEEKQDKGEVIIFFLGGKPVGNGKYLIDIISRSHKRVDNKGNLLSISFNVSLIEYPENARKETKVLTTAKATVKKKASNTIKKKATTQKVTTSSLYLKKDEIAMPTIGTSLWELLGKQREEFLRDKGASGGGSGGGVR